MGSLRFPRPAGGYFVWAQVPAGVTSAEFVTAARREGIAVSDGAVFYPAAPPGDAAFVRLSFSLYEPDPLRTAGKRLAQLADRMTTAVPLMKSRRSGLRQADARRVMT